jgi:hypothetical protein
MKKLIVALGIALCGTATPAVSQPGAAPVWTQYLCRYTTHIYGQSHESDEQTVLIEVSDNNGPRVLFHDKDLGVLEGRPPVIIDAKKIFFEVHEGSWGIMKSTGSFFFSAIIRSQKRVGRGKCKVVTD